MNELIANKIYAIKETIAYEQKRESEALKKKDTKSYFWYAGVVEGLKVSLRMLEDIQTQYEMTEQSIKEALDFLGGK